MHYLLSIPRRIVIAIIAMGKAIPLQAWTVPEGSTNSAPVGHDLLIHEVLRSRRTTAGRTIDQPDAETPT